MATKHELSVFHIEDEDGNAHRTHDKLEWLRSFKHRWGISTDVDGAKVSTVFLGIPHDLNGSLYETLVFGGEHDGSMSRYQTRAEAIAGHEEMVHRVKG